MLRIFMNAAGWKYAAAQAVSNEDCEIPVVSGECRQLLEAAGGTAIHPEILETSILRLKEELAGVSVMPSEEEIQPTGEKHAT